MQIFEKKGKRLIGLYDPGESRGLFCLANITICENFHSIGKYDSLNMASNMYVKIIIAFLGKNFVTPAVIKAKLGEFFSSILVLYF